MRARFWISCSIAIALVGCAGRSDLEGPDGGAGAGEGGAEDAGPPPITKSDKIDLLLVLDNSKNLEVAHALLAETVPYLLERLARPACVNGLGNVVATTPGPDDPCPVGERDFRPATDLHLAVISTSIGGHGADICSPGTTSWDPQMNDAAHLLSRNQAGGVVPTYGGQGFLWWDPGQVAAPPGESDLGALSAKLAEVVRGVGRDGCGFESQLESIYRFLVDPDPYESITIEGSSAVPVGTDQVVLQQRADFLRPDSAVVVALLSDENDCSTREGGQFYFSNQLHNPDGSSYHLPRARSECAANPQDPCCASCGQTPAQGCPPNSADSGCLSPPFTDAEDPVNLRCFDQKRRFGIDFLYPVDRYVRAFTEATVADRTGELAPNPLFAGDRSPELVLFAGIVGVPWQDIAADPHSLSVGYRPAAEIDWALIVGDPATGAPPLDPLMIESVAPREGTSPVLGVELAPPSAPLPTSNPINGHERILSGADDLQYACIFPRPSPKDCTVEVDDCHCADDDVGTNPICQAADGSYGPVERWARALPGTRELRVLQGLGDQAIVASICAPVVSGSSQATFAYKPAVDAILRSLRRRLE
ncbi:MAG: hypothetical protein IT372_12350 [Polyangiaceae bacterium]|nr:hypothetical protein [Polyangiaceae bacterium]